MKLTDIDADDPIVRRAARIIVATIVAISVVVFVIYLLWFEIIPALIIRSGAYW